MSTANHEPGSGQKNPHAAALGRIRSERKAAAARENARLPRPGGRKPRKRRPLEDFPCTCGGCPDQPRTNCPRGRAILRRRAEDQAES